MLVLKIAGGMVLGVIVLIVGCAILIGAALNSSPQSEALLTGNAGDVLVVVTGDAGAFSGSLGALGNQRSIQGITPESFVIPGADSSGIFTALIQKKGAAGRLRVELTGCPDKGVHVGETVAAYGLVTVSC